MKLLESIDRLLMESPESLGFSKKIADEIRSVIPGNRKAQDYIAKWFKGASAPNDKDVMKVITSRSSDIINLYTQMARAYGVRDAKDYDKAAFARRSLYGLVRSNIKTVDDLRVMRKKLDKALKRMDVGRTERDAAQEHIDRLMVHSLEYFQKKYASLIEFLKEDPNNYRQVSADDLKDALRVAEGKLREGAVDEERVFIKLSDGYFWYEVADDECSTEGNLMGHCGRKSWHNSTMYSLRDSSNSPHVTIEYNKGTIIQLKGKGNERPSSKYTKHIKEFLKKTNAHIDEDWHTNGDGEVLEYLDMLTSEHGSHDYSMFEMTMDHLNRWLREQLTELEEVMDLRFSRSDHLLSFYFEVDDSEVDIGELEFSVALRAEMPTHLFRGEENTQKFHEILEPEYVWLEENADSWLFNGKTIGGHWDRFDWIDGTYATEDAIEIEGFKLIFREWIDEGGEEVFMEHVTDTILTVTEGWTEENFVKGADVIYRRLVEPKL